MNKLLFQFEQQFNDDIILVANNEKDLEDYLRSEYPEWHSINIVGDHVAFKQWKNSPTEYGKLTWVKHI